MYNTEGGINVGPILFADDNLNPLRLSNAEEVRPLLSYTVNTNKSAA